jgi:GH43 family beta-xylosidase
MKKTRAIALLLIMVMLLPCILLTGCKSQVQYEIPSYQGLPEDGQSKAEFNQELFYRNDHKIDDAADPFVFDNTDRDGYYYLFGTHGDIFCSRSTDLVNWEPVGNALDIQDYVNNQPSEVRRTVWKDIWAPEVVYDPDDGKYYMFFSATPDPDTNVTAGNGVMQGSYKELMMVAVSDYPDHGFVPVNFMDATSCGEENLHDFNTTLGIKDPETGEYLPAWPHYFAKYLLFDPAEYMAFAEANGGFRGLGRGGFEGGIDPHPYVDENGDKYLFWVDSSGSDRISVVKMENWLKPDWSTAKILACHSFYTVDDYFASLDGKIVENVPYELLGTSINEGPAVLKHNGKYYLTFSVGAYSDNSYQVVQAVSDSLTGPYRKLTMEEGAILMSGELSGSQDITGTGHHSFVEAGDQLLMIYHRHNDPIVGGGARNPAIDEIKWITIKDKNGNDIEVMYANGPTATVQPKIEAFSDYKNIADEATISGHDDVKYLNDGLLSVYKYLNEDFGKYIQETVIDKTTTFTLDFEEARAVRAVMVYASKDELAAFAKIARIEFVCIEDGKEVVRYIKDVELSAECYQANDYDGSIFYISPGAAAYAEFDELNVKSIRITIDVPANQDSVGISEIRVLGK